MKRRFRQRQDPAPKIDHEKDNGKSKDEALENVDIDDVIREIDTSLMLPENVSENQSE
jgi:hypothetical protein